MIETWKDIPGWPGYMVSNFGNIISFKRSKDGRPLSQQVSRNGYLFVHLRDRDRNAVLQCHRLVMLAFCPIDNADTMEVNHKNENKQDNRLDNLEWVTRLENIRYGTGIQRRAQSNNKSVLCIDLNLIFDSMKQASEIMDINYANLSSCCSGRLSTAGGYKWKVIEK